MTITIDDLIDRLRRYDEARARVLPADLTMALLRLDINTADIPAARKTLRRMKVRVISDKKIFLAPKAGKIVADYLTDPAWEPELFPQECAQISRELSAVVLARSLKHLPVPCFTRRVIECTPMVFPHWHRYHALPLQWSEYVKNQVGFIALQLSRSAQPLPAHAAINLLGVQRPGKKPETTNRCAQALMDAWERGLLIPGVADARLLDYQESPKALKAFADAMREFAQEGMLSVIWPVLDDLIALSAAQTSLLAGTATLSELMADCAPAVRLGIERGIAPPSAAAVPGLRALAARSGSSKAVRAAQEALAALPEVPQELSKSTLAP